MTLAQASRMAALTACAVLLPPDLSQAAAIERAVPSIVRLMFEEGRYGEIGIVYTDPDQRGRGADLNSLGIPLAVPGRTDDVFDTHYNFSGGYKADLPQGLSYGLFFDQPYGADTNYGRGSFAPLPFSYDGTIAELNTYQITGVLAYDPTEAIKIFAGLRAQRLDANAAIPFVSNYTVDADADWGYGFLVGAAYSRPEIGFRVALTYLSEVSHDLDTAEFTDATGPQETGTDIDTPQSVTLEAQTGLNDKTLLFGSIRWVNWSAFTIAPPAYVLVTGGRPLVDYEEDWWTYTLGLARSFTDDLAGSFSVAYEPPTDEVLTTLGPYDGRTSATAALSYDIGPANVTGGLTYGVLGDTSNLLDTKYRDGTVLAAGLRIGYSF